MSSVDVFPGVLFPGTATQILRICENVKDRIL